MKAFVERNRNVQIDEPVFNPLKSRRSDLPLKGLCKSNVEFLLTDCGDDIFRYLLFLEQQHELDCDFLKGLTADVTGRIRQIVADWFLHVQQRFSFLDETLSLAIWIFDRVLPKLNPTKDTIQLIGVTCLFVAAKYEEILVPTVNDFVFVASDLFSKKDVLAMERHVLTAIDFKIGVVHSEQFLQRYQNHLQTPAGVCKVAKFICDVGMVVYVLAHYRPSVTAAVAMYLSTIINEFPISNKTFRAVTNIDHSLMDKIAREFAPHVLIMSSSTAKLHGLYDKHKKSMNTTLFNDVQIKRLKKLCPFTNSKS